LEIIMTDTTNACIVCGGTKDLTPLFSDRDAEAQPVTWIHLACLSLAVADDSSDTEAFQNLRKSRSEKKDD
jgi:hypothetical protein